MRAALVVVLLIGLAGVAGAQEWQMFKGGPDRVGFSTSTVRELEGQWRVQREGSWSSPAVAGERVYAGLSLPDGGGRVYAFRVIDGKEVWKSKVIGEPSSPAVAVVDGVVYVGSGDNHVYAFYAENGKEKWFYPTGGPVSSSPAVVGRRVFVGSGDGKVYAIDADTGALIWENKTGGRITSSPAVAGGKVFVSSWDGYVYAFNAETGERVWTFMTAGEYALVSSPAVAGGRVYVGSNLGRCVYSLDAATGENLWEFVTGGHVESSPSVIWDRVYVGSDDNHVYCVDTQGRENWKFKTGDRVQSSPAIADGKVFIASWDGYLYALWATNGGNVWEPRFIGKVGRASPAVAYGRVFIGNTEGDLFAFGLPVAVGELPWRGVLYFLLALMLVVALLGLRKLPVRKPRRRARKRRSHGEGTNNYVSILILGLFFLSTVGNVGATLKSGEEFYFDAYQDGKKIGNMRFQVLEDLEFKGKESIRTLTTLNLTLEIRGTEANMQMSIEDYLRRIDFFPLHSRASATTRVRDKSIELEVKANIDLGARIVTIENLKPNRGIKQLSFEEGTMIASGATLFALLRGRSLYLGYEENIATLSVYDLEKEKIVVVGQASTSFAGRSWNVWVVNAGGSQYRVTQEAPRLILKSELKGDPLLGNMTMILAGYRSPTGEVLGQIPGGIGLPLVVLWMIFAIIVVSVIIFLKKRRQTSWDQFTW